MSVSYTKDERAEAKEQGKHLATIAIFGMEFSGMVTEDEGTEVAQFLLDFQKKRRAREAEKAAAK